MTAPQCTATRIGFGACVHKDTHPGWHRNKDGAEWPQHDVDLELDALLTGDSYQLRATEVTR